MNIPLDFEKLQHFALRMETSERAADDAHADLIKAEQVRDQQLAEQENNLMVLGQSATLDRMQEAYTQVYNKFMAFADASRAFQKAIDDNNSFIVSHIKTMEKPYAEACVNHCLGLPNISQDLRDQLLSLI